ncbi:ribosomal protein S18-alanine N-acetyltransferase [Glutamicibacter endophyticus]|uniref:ribosomal protein S18-alanine N-acetyltransferase n=1 Tax=Glutamicibacter endophyticus TaxID=1522174 RepID=UPI003AF196AA
MSPELRWMTTDDIPAVHALETELFPGDPWPLEGFVAELEQVETRDYWVYEADGQILGYAGLCTVAEFADVQTIGVAPAAQGQGLGRKLMQTLIARAQERGAEQVMLEVRVDNPVAIGLYASLGFENIHIRPGYYKGGIDAQIMRLPLPLRVTADATLDEKD